MPAMDGPHQYIERRSGRVVDEKPLADRVVNLLYSRVKENARPLFNALIGRRVSSALGFWNYDTLLASKLKPTPELFAAYGADPAECLEDPTSLDTPRQVFERKIRYWQCRPMPEETGAVVSPADSRVILGSLAEQNLLFLKGKFFDLAELLGGRKTRWRNAFDQGDFAVFRLTPDKYHWVHTPVAGRVLDFYELAGRFHSCNPTATVAELTPLSKNKRGVTILDTDQLGGSGAGLVALVEVAALMVGDIVQSYCDEQYENPRQAAPGMFLQKGLPKALFRPGGSTVVLLFQKGRFAPDQDLLCNQTAAHVNSRFSAGFGRSLVETELRVRERIGLAQGEGK